MRYFWCEVSVSVLKGVYMIKNVIFVLSLLSCAVASSVFIPLQKDGSVRWGGSVKKTQTQQPESSEIIVVEGDLRSPAGTDGGNGYVPPPDTVPVPEPEYVPAPSSGGKDEAYVPPSAPTKDTVYNPPASTPVYTSTYNSLGIFACISQGLKPPAEIKYTGERNVGVYGINMPDKYIALFAVDALKQEQWSPDRAVRETIRAITSVGYCPRGTYDYRSGEEEIVSQWLNTGAGVSGDQYTRIFGVKYGNAIPRKGYSWTGTSSVQQRSTWRAANQGTPPYICSQGKYAFEKVRRSLCRSLYRTCGFKNRLAECDEPEDRSGNREERRNDRGGNSGGTSGGSSSGGGGREVGSGSNESSGHGGNRDGGHGDGPSGTSQ
jgi:hypothetical protein